jgi:hypothetical protein
VPAIIPKAAIAAALRLFREHGVAALPGRTALVEAAVDEPQAASADGVHDGTIHMCSV